MKKLSVLMMVFSVFCVMLSAESIRFAIIGDRAGGPDQKVFETAIRDVARMDPDIVMTVGDIADNCDEKQWDMALRAIKTLTMPFYYVPGNNDIVDAATEELYIKKTGMKPHYSFDQGSVHFIVLDNARPDKVEDFDATQMKWLAQDLEKAQGKMILVFMHKPFWAAGVAVGKKDPLHELFKKYAVTAVFTGHWHQYAHDVYDGVRYYLVGSSGAGMPGVDEEMGVVYHYAWCTVKDGKLTVAPVKVGSTFAEDLVTIAEEQLYYAIPNEMIRAQGSITTSSDVKTDIFIKNATDKQMQEKVILTLPENWKADTQQLDITIAAGLTTTQSVVLTRNGSLFPLPTVSFTYPFGRGKKYVYNKPFTLIREINCPVVKSPVAIDGVINDSEWKNAVIVNEFAGFNGKPAKTEDTSVYMYRDEKNLYIAVRCSESVMASIKADALTRDSEVYGDDSVSFMFSADGKSVRQLYVNSNGAVWDILAQDDKVDQKWNGEYEIKTTKNIDSWVVEMKIPFKTLGYDKKFGKIAVNMRRKQIRNKENALMMPSWNFNFNEYATIIMGDVKK